MSTPGVDVKAESYKIIMRGLEQAADGTELGLTVSQQAIRNDFMALCERVRADTIQEIKAWSSLSAKQCPLCEYRDGVFISGCNFHAYTQRGPMEYQQLALAQVGELTDKQRERLAKLQQNIGQPEEGKK